MDDVDLNLLPALDALLATGSVAGAARALGLSASATSRTLARLRVATGDPLLVRAGRGLVATPHAVALRDRVHELARDARTVLRPTTDRVELATLDRTFRLRANDGFVEAFAAPLIAAASADAPGVRLHFLPRPDKDVRSLRDGAIDLEIGVADRSAPEIRIQALFRDRFVGVVRHDHPLARLRTVSAARYAAHAHVVVSRHGEPDGPVDDALRALGLERQVRAVVPGFAAAIAVARASDLIALVPRSCLDAPHGVARTDAPHAFALPVRTEPITVSQMWHPRLHADAAHRWLRGLLHATCGAVASAATRRS